MAHRKVTLVPAKAIHLSEIARTMQDGDRAEIVAAAAVPRHLLYSLWQESHYSRAAFVDDTLAAVWGCAASFLSPYGHAWLVTAPVVAEVPMAFVREARKGIADMMEGRRMLYSACLASYAKSRRFWTLLGFEIGEPIEITTGAIFCPLTMER